MHGDWRWYMCNNKRQTFITSELGGVASTPQGGWNLAELGGSLQWTKGVQSHNPPAIQAQPVLIKAKISTPSYDAPVMWMIPRMPCHLPSQTHYQLLILTLFPSSFPNARFKSVTCVFIQCSWNIYNCDTALSALLTIIITTQVSKLEKNFI